MHAARGKWLIALAMVPALSGCGPSREQVLFYELELAVVSFGVAWFLMWLGRVVFDSRVWFVCSYCLKPSGRHDVRDGTLTKCLHCGRTTSVNELPPDIVRRVAADGKTRRLRLVGRTRARRLVIMFLLAVAFQIVLILAGLLLGYVLRAVGTWPGFNEHRPWHEVAYPLVFALSMEGNPWPWWWFNWVLLVSFHLGGTVNAFVDHVLHAPAILVGSPGSTVAIGLAQLTLWWFFIVLGYRLRVRWWLVPGLVAGVNTVVAIVAYITDWSR